MRSITYGILADMEKNESRPARLHYNLEQFGTLYNTLAKDRHDAKADRALRFGEWHWWPLSLTCHVFFTLRKPFWLTRPDTVD